MKLNARQRMRSLVMLGFGLIALVVSVPLLVSAQGGGTPSATPSGDPVIEQGRMIYSNVCIACHQPDGKGVEGIYLPLAGNPLVTLEDPTYLITVILTGRGGMPTFANTYDDAEVAAIATYIRQEWGNNGTPVTPEQVAEVRASINAQPLASPTPEGQIPSGISTPEASPASGG